MLASETEEISEFLKSVLFRNMGKKITKLILQIRDTLCYATNENQKATYGLLEVEADLAIVVGGYNSSNITLGRALRKASTYFFIKSEEEIISKNLIQHFDYQKKELLQTQNFLPKIKSRRSY